MKIRYGQQEDFEWLRAQDNHVGADWIKRCLHHGEYIIAADDGEILGFLRFSLFWGNIPYMDMIRVQDNHKRRGIGTAMLNFWERDMRARGAKVLMTSSVVHETEPQDWHKRNGFQECGQLTFGQHEPTPEVFFVKDL